MRKGQSITGIAIVIIGIICMILPLFAVKILFFFWIYGIILLIIGIIILLNKEDEIEEIKNIHNSRYKKTKSETIKYQKNKR